MEAYLSKVEQYSKIFTQINKRYNSISLLRLLSIFFCLFMLFYYIKTNETLYAVFAFLSFVGFLFLMRIHSKISFQKQLTKADLKINEDEITYLKREKLPFEITAGISQLVENVPIRWHLTFENLQQWNIAFANPNRAKSSLDGASEAEKVSFFNNALRHVILGAELFPEKAFNIRLGYNFRRGQELNIIDQRNFSGISAGFSLRFNKVRFDFSHSRYTIAANSSIFGLMINLD